MSFHKIPVRLPVTLKAEVVEYCKRMGLIRSAFYRSAIDAGADLGLNAFCEAYQKSQFGEQGAADSASISERHEKLLDARRRDVIERLLKPKRCRRKKRPTELGATVLFKEPTRSDVLRVMVKLFLATLPKPDLARAETLEARAAAATAGLLATPQLIAHEALPAEVCRRLKPSQGQLKDLSEAKGFVHFIDATALLAATVRLHTDDPHKPNNIFDPSSQRMQGVLTLARQGELELFIFRSELTRYCQFLFKALTLSCLPIELVEREVLTRGQLALSSRLNLVELEPAGVVEANKLPEAVPAHLRLIIAQAVLTAKGRPVVVITCSHELVGLSPKVLVWHPNDLVLPPKPLTNEQVVNNLRFNNRPK